MKVCPSCQQEYGDGVDFCPTDGMKLRVKRAAVADPLVGTVLDGRWIIEEKIGEGGMGSVYKGYQKSVDRKVAIKTLRAALADSDEFVDRFFREAKIATRINHPNCVTILDFGQSNDGTLYLAMEFMEGVPLSDRMHDSDLTIEEIVKIGIQVSAGLSAAHDVSIVHRDLKPDNIFLVNISGGDTHAKVLDFGIAKALDSKTQVTKTGMIFGTPEYMSPEQCRGTTIDGRSDLYSLGCILYELLGGRTPFSATTPMAVLLAHVNDQVVELQSVASTIVPANLNAIVMKLLSKNPDERFRTATAVKTELEQLLGNLKNPKATIDYLSVSGFDQTAAAPVATDELIQAHKQSQPNPVPNTGPQTEPKQSNSRLFFGLGALVFFIAVAAVAVVVLTPGLFGGPIVEHPVAATATTTESIERIEPTIAAEVKDENRQVAETGKVVGDEPVEKPKETTVAKMEKAPKKKAVPTKPKKKTAVVKKKKTSKTKTQTTTKKPEKEKLSENEEAQKKVEEEKKKAEKKIGKKIGRKIEKQAEKVGKDLNKALDGLMGK